MRFRFLALGAALALPLAMSAQSTTYTYTGSDYTYSDVYTPSTGDQPVNPPGTIAAPFTSSDSVNGSFTLSGNTDNLSSSQYFTSATFSFTDGAQTFSSQDGDSFFGSFATDGNGNLTNYSLEVSDPSVPNDFIEIIDVPPGGSPASFAKYQITPDDVVDAGTNTLGSFTAMQVSATPEPGSLALMGTGMAGLMFEMRRRLHRA